MTTTQNVETVAPRQLVPGDRIVDRLIPSMVIGIVEDIEFLTNGRIGIVYQGAQAWDVPTYAPDDTIVRQVRKHPITEAIESAKPIKGTRYSLGSYIPTVGLSARPRAIYILVLDGFEVDRGSKTDIMRNVKSAPGTPLGVCHARYDAVAASQK